LPAVLSVKIVAPAEIRAARLAGAYGMALEVAREAVESGDREQREYNRALFDADWDDPLHWDVIVNSEAVAPEIARDVILAGFGEGDAPVAVGSEMAEVLSIASGVNEALVDDRFAQAWLLATPTSDGIVLHGDAVDSEQAQAALEVAQRVGSGRKVMSDLTVRGRPIAGWG
jgi:hypothetical protein